MINGAKQKTPFVLVINFNHPCLFIPYAVYSILCVF